jgi:hypothetical protein
LRKISALIRFYFKEDPDKLSDEEWAKRWNDLTYALSFDKQLGRISKIT